jgi:hypothetical protein
MKHESNGRKNTNRDASDVIRVGAKPGAEAEDARWTFVLVLFFRLVSLLWIAQGLEQWRRIVAPADGAFLDLSVSAASATVFFALLNPVAGVGLWLIAPWGGVVWLLTLIAQIFVAAHKPSFFIFGAYLKYFDGLLLAIYLFLSSRASSASGELTAIDRIVVKAWELVQGSPRRD